MNENEFLETIKKMLKIHLDKQRQIGWRRDIPVFSSIVFFTPPPSENMVFAGFSPEMKVPIGYKRAEPKKPITDMEVKQFALLLETIEDLEKEIDN